MSLRLPHHAKDDLKSGDLGGFYRGWLHLIIYLAGGPLAKAVFY